MRTLPDPIGHDVRKELDRFGPAGRMGDVVAAWASAVGPGIAANAWPARIGRDGILHVAAASSAWAFELTQLAETVLGCLRDALGDACPAALRFAVGPLPELGDDVEKLRDRTVPAPTEEQIEEGQRIARPIADPALREAVERAVAASLALASRPPADRPV